MEYKYNKIIKIKNLYKIKKRGKTYENNAYFMKDFHNLLWNQIIYHRIKINIYPFIIQIDIHIPPLNATTPSPWGRNPHLFHFKKQPIISLAFSYCHLISVNPPKHNFGSCKYLNPLLSLQNFLRFP